MAPLDKGKGKSKMSAAIDNDTTTQPLLSTNSADTSPQPFSARRTQPVRHGRGPLIRDSDDDDDNDGALDDLLGDGLDDAAESGSLRKRRKSPTAHSGRRRWSRSGLLCTTLCTVFLLLLAVLAVAHLWIGHLLSEEEARSESLEVMARRGLKWTEPTNVRFVGLQEENTSLTGDFGDDGFLVLIDGVKAGFDVRSAIGWEDKDRNEKKKGSGLTQWRRRVEARMMRWTVHRVKATSVAVSRITIYEGSHKSDDDQVLVLASLDRKMVIPLSYPRSGNEPVRLDDLDLRVRVEGLNSEALAEMARKSWESKSYRVYVEVDGVTWSIRDYATGFVGWAARALGVAKAGVDNVGRVLAGKIPDMPGASDPASLVKLLKLDISETHTPDSNTTTVIGVDALARLKNPLLPLFKSGDLPRMAYGVPFRLPVEILLPAQTRARQPNVPASNLVESAEPRVAAAASAADEGIVLARVATDPFHFAADDKTTDMTLSGQLVPIAHAESAQEGQRRNRDRDDDDDESPLSAALSRFFARYLAGKSNKVLVRYDSTTPSLPSTAAAPNANLPPPVIGDILRQFGTVPLEMPGAEGHLELFKNLKIEDMKIKLAGMLSSPLHMAGFANGGRDDDDDEGDLLCSGRVVGEVALPEMLEGLMDAVGVHAIWPDVYVYDGGLPPSASGSRLLARDQLSFATDDDDDEDDSITSYPPIPTPQTAFARLSPKSLIPATTVHYPRNATHNATTIVSATFTNAPLYILPGRSDVFRHFVGKIIFGGGGGPGGGQKVKAGAKGVTRVQVDLRGWGQVAVRDMPIEAEFWVGAGGVEA